jgi:orotidine-5'-phosphate decarboxylase
MGPGPREPLHAADRLLAAIERAGAPVCVGLDPVLERLPAALRGRGLEGVRSFCLGVLDAVAGVVPAIKLQSACFERHGHRGVEAAEAVAREASGRGMQVILDVKRGDIAVSAGHYAEAAWGDSGPDPDWITIQSYLGEDGITPFLRRGRGAFALVRTSNPGGDTVQAQELADGRSVAESVAAMVARLGAADVGASGYSSLGAVVGATRASEARRLRDLMPRQLFLVPGYGAQGGTADDVRACFDGQGRGAIVTASRSVIYAFDPGDARWEDAVASSAKRLRDEVGRAVA